MGHRSSHFLGQSVRLNEISRRDNAVLSRPAGFITKDFRQTGGGENLGDVERQVILTH